VGPLLRRVWWLLGRVLILAAGVAWAYGGGPWLAPFMWLIFGYIFARALPGIRGDVDQLRGLLRLKSVRRSVRGGEF